MDIEYKYKLSDLPILDRIGNLYSLGAFNDAINGNFAEATRNGAWVRVDSPGFYTWPTLAKNTGRSYVFFDKPGKYALSKIYKHLRDTMQPNGLESNKILDHFDNGWYKNTISRQLRAAFVYPSNSVAKIAKNKHWKGVISDYTKISKGKAPKFTIDRQQGNINQNVKQHLIEDRYYPIAYDEHREQLFLVQNDGRPAYVSAVGINHPNLIKSGFDNFKAKTGYDGFIFALDIEKNRIVASEELFKKVGDRIRGNLRAWRYYQSIHDEFSEDKKDLPPVSEFLAKLNQHFIDSGFPGLKAKKGYKANAEVYYSAYNYESRENGYYGGRGYNGYIPGYTCEIYYKDKLILSKNQTYIRENDDGSGFTLISSAWCQRISHWSKYKARVVDQFYNIWPIVDWITGPFAEMNELRFDEAPVVFMGQKNYVSKDRKRNAIKDLKNKVKRARK